MCSTGGGVRETVGVAVSLGVMVGVCVAVAVVVGVRVAVAVGVGVWVGDAVGVSDGVVDGVVVALGDVVSVGVSLAVGDGVVVGLAVLVGVGLGMRVGTMAPRSVAVGGCGVVVGVLSPQAARIKMNKKPNNFRRDVTSPSPGMKAVLYSHNCSEEW